MATNRSLAYICRFRTNLTSCTTTTTLLQGRICSSSILVANCLSRRKLVCPSQLFSKISIVQPNVIPKRYRKKGSSVSKKGAAKDEVDEEDGDEDDDGEDDTGSENPLLVDDILNPVDDGSEQTTIEIGSLRLDVFTKVAFNMTRAKVEELFYKGDIYINGEKPAKKSVELATNDEVDVIKQINTEDNKLVDIKRALIVSLPDKANEHGKMKVQVRRWLNLTIDSPARKQRDYD